jgi:hypothetical protein
MEIIPVHCILTDLKLIESSIKDQRVDIKNGRILSNEFLRKNPRNERDIARSAQYLYESANDLVVSKNNIQTRLCESSRIDKIVIDYNEMTKAEATVFENIIKHTNNH